MASEKTSSHDIKINKIELEKPNGTKLVVHPPPSEGNNPPSRILGSLTITEGLFTSGMRGTLKILDPSSVGDDFNIIGNEKIIIDFETPSVDDSQHSLTFCAHDVKYSGDDTDDKLRGPAQRIGAAWRIDFVTCEKYLLNWNELDYMNEDFIGKIAGIHDEMGPGLIDVLAQKYFDPEATPFSYAANAMDIEPTHNSIWLKSNQNMYPWGKDTNQPNLINLMNNLSENAVTESQIGMNYLFYQDFGGWHFKSINKMIEDSTSSSWFGLIETDNKRTYFITDSDDPNDREGNDRRIQNMVMLNEYSHMLMWEKGAYSSYYELVKPNYEDPYFEYMDSVSRHQKSKINENDEEDEDMFWGKRRIVTFDYHKDTKDWPRITGEGGFSLLPDSIDTSVDVEEIHKGKGRKSVRKYDDSGMWGYFSSLYNNPQETPMDYLGSRNSNGKYGKTNDMMWQTQFDQTDLKAETLYTIQKKIKEPLREKHEEYVQLKNLKRKWNVYRHSVCCDKKTNKYQFLAVIEDARQIQENERGGIFEYSWREVEIWPKEFLGNPDDDDIEDLSHDEAPVAIVVVKGGAHGELMEEDQNEWTNPSYNINELFNNEDDEDNVYVGPGINVADDDHNDYPQSYQMMPVGGYFKIDDDPCVLETASDVYYHKHIVQMYRMPGKVLDTIEPKPKIDEDGIEDKGVPEDFYFFDVPNAHDGLCDCP